MPMPTRFERWIRSKLSAMTKRTPSKRDALGGIAHRDVVDEPVLTIGEVDRVRTLLALDEVVLQADVREGATDHHLVLAAPRAVGVELERSDTVALEPLAGR